LDLLIQKIIGEENSSCNNCFIINIIIQAFFQFELLFFGDDDKNEIDGVILRSKDSKIPNELNGKQRNNTQSWEQHKRRNIPAMIQQQQY
jgi:hypothetical protein